MNYHGRIYYFCKKQSFSMLNSIETMISMNKYANLTFHCFDNTKGGNIAKFSGVHSQVATHEIPRGSTRFHEVPRTNSGFPRGSTRFHEVPRNNFVIPRGSHEVPTRFHEVPTRFHEVPRGSTKQIWAVQRGWSVCA
jgi:hypothetical protein